MAESKNEKRSCPCGGSFLLKHKAEHYRCAKHRAYVNGDASIIGISEDVTKKRYRVKFSRKGLLVADCDSVKRFPYGTSCRPREVALAEAIAWRTALFEKYLRPDLAIPDGGTGAL